MVRDAGAYYALVQLAAWVLSGSAWDPPLNKATDSAETEDNARLLDDNTSGRSSREQNRQSNNISRPLGSGQRTPRAGDDQCGTELSTALVHGESSRSTDAEASIIQEHRATPLVAHLGKSSSASGPSDRPGEERSANLTVRYQPADNGRKLS
jgi:hypothetical protein